MNLTLIFYFHIIYKGVAAMNLNNLSSCDLIGLSSSLAILVGENLSANEASLLSAFFTAFADNLAIIATKKSISDSNN